MGVDPNSSELSTTTHRSSEPANHLLRLLIAGRVPIHFSQILLQTLALPSAPIFHSCVNFTPASRSETRLTCSVPELDLKLCSSKRSTAGLDFCHPDRSSGAVCRRGARILRPTCFTGMEGPRQPTNPFAIRSVHLRPAFSRCLLPLPAYSPFLSFPFIFPLVEIPFSI